jgi:predicted O-linked N-acetylglucosamine transferase (SPINDLY family)
MAIDLNGYTDGGRPGIFALRPAPVQVSYLGYAATMGAPFIDFILADCMTIPLEIEEWYAEKVIRLSSGAQPPMKRMVAERTPTRSECGLPATGFVFCCFNGAYKITPQVFAVWMRLLRQIEGSVLWLSVGRASAEAHLKKAAHASGVEPNRLVFAQRVADPAAHLARYRVADLFLDTLPVNAHTTAGDALGSGLPVLTCAGRGFASRMAASLLKAAGMSELVTASLEEYEALALSIATVPGLLDGLRAQLSSHCRSNLVDATRAYAREFEAACLGALRAR